jgi:hypothetical protein
MTGLYVDSIKDASNTKTLATLSSSAATLHSDVVFPSGHVLQVTVSNDTDAESTTSNTEIFTGLEASITISAGNKVLIIISQPFRLYGSGSGTSGRECYIRIRRGTDATVGNNTSIFRTGDNQVAMNASGTGGFSYVAGITYVDNNPGAGTHKYRTSMITDDTQYQIKAQPSSTNSFMVLQEIKG